MKSIVSPFLVSAFMAFSLLLGGCSEDNASTAGEASTSNNQPQAESKVENPKNGANTHPCDFLSSEDASSLGFKREGIPSPDSPDELCIWETENGERSVSLGVMDRKIQDCYDGKSFYPDYREFTIAGYPAVRANQGDPSADGICAMAVAINDNQVLTVTTMDLPIIDPCGLAQKSLEAAVPNLPAAN